MLTSVALTERDKSLPERRPIISKRALSDVTVILVLHLRMQFIPRCTCVLNLLLKS